MKLDMPIVSSHKFSAEKNGGRKCICVLGYVPNERLRFEEAFQNYHQIKSLPAIVRRITVHEKLSDMFGKELRTVKRICTLAHLTYF